MGRDNNLIKYGIKNIHIFPITGIDTTKTDGTAYSYDTAFAVPGTQQISLAANWANNTVYADDIAYAEQTANLGYDGNWQNVKLTEEFEEKILGDINGQENADTQITPFGMSFEFTGDKNGGRVFLYHVDLTKRPDLTFNTKTNSLSVDSDTIGLNVKPRLDTHDVKVKVYPGDALYDSILTTAPNPVQRAAQKAVEITGLSTVEKNETITLSATTQPAGQAVTWESLDPDNASVTSGGVVAGLAEGTATIKCSITADPTVYATKVITVTDSQE